jgi:hypothetical protein
MPFRAPSNNGHTTRVHPSSFVVSVLVLVVVVEFTLVEELKHTHNPRTEAPIFVDEFLLDLMLRVISR